MVDANTETLLREAEKYNGYHQQATLVIRDLAQALADVVVWAGPIAGDNRDEVAAFLEINSIETAHELLHKLRSQGVVF